LTLPNNGLYLYVQGAIKPPPNAGTQEIKKMTNQNTIKINYATDDNYMVYNGQVNPQPAYIEIDFESREMWSDVQTAIGWSTSQGVMDGTSVRIGINPMLAINSINDLMDELAPMAEQMCDEYDAADGHITDDLAGLETNAQMLRGTYDGDMIEIDED